LKHFTSQIYYFIGITSKEETDLIFRGIEDVLDDEMLELHQDNNEIIDFTNQFNRWRDNFDTNLSANIDIKNIPVNLQNNQLTAMESLDISLKLPVLLQSLENVMYNETADPNKKHKFLENLALLILDKKFKKEEQIMKTVKISLNSIDKVKAFVNEVTKFDAEFDLVSGRYVIDAKSIMGIFSLDLSKPIDLNIHSENDVDAILEKLQPFIV